MLGDFEKLAYAALQSPEQDQQVKRDIPYAEPAHEGQVLDVYSPHDARAGHEDLGRPGDPATKALLEFLGKD